MLISNMQLYDNAVSWRPDTPLENLDISVQKKIIPTSQSISKVAKVVKMIELCNCCLSKSNGVPC